MKLFYVFSTVSNGILDIGSHSELSKKWDSEMSMSKGLEILDIFEIAKYQEALEHSEFLSINMADFEVKEIMLEKYGKEVYRLLNL
jgi:hypothetical protein